MASRGEVRRMMKQNYINEGQKRTENRRMRKMGVKRKHDAVERKKKAKMRRLEDHLDTSASADLMDDNALRQVHIEDMSWNIDEEIKKEDRREHLISECSQSQLEALQRKVSKCISKRVQSKKLGSVKFESGAKTDEMLLATPREISVDRLIECTDPLMEIQKTYPNITQKLGTMDDHSFSTMRAVRSYMEPFRLLSQRQRGSGRRNISKIFGLKGGRQPDEVLGGAGRSSRSLAVPTMSRADWYIKFEELGCRSCHEMSLDERHLVVVYLHVRDDAFVAVALHKSHDDDRWKWINYCFLQRGNEEMLHFKDHDDDDSDKEPEEELVLGVEKPKEELTRSFFDDEADTSKSGHHHSRHILEDDDDE